MYLPVLTLLLLFTISLAPVTIYAETVLVDADIPYDVVGDKPMRIVDISVPQSPLHLATIPGFDSQLSADSQIASIDGIAYLFAVDAQDNTMHVVSIDNPYAPESITTFTDWSKDANYSITTDLEVVQVHGNAYVLVAIGDTIQVVDVSDPEAPVYAGHIRDATYNNYALNDILEIEQFVHDNGRTYIMVGGGGDAIQILDVTDLPRFDTTSVIRNGHYGFEGITDISDIETIQSDGKTFALISGYGTIAVVDVTELSFPVQVALIDDQNGFLGMKSNFCTIIQCGNELNQFYNSMSIIDVAVMGDITVVLDFEAVYVLDFSNVTSPSIVSTTVLPKSIDDFKSVSVVEIKEKLWAVVGGQSVFALDITDVSSPVPAYMLDDMTLYGLVGIDTAIIDGRTYAVATSTENHAVHVIDVTDPNNPTQVASVGGNMYGLGGLYGPHDVRIVDISGGTYALISNINGNSFVIIDITDPTKPIFTTSVKNHETLFAPAYIDAMKIDKKTYAVISNHFSAGIEIIDITNPHEPEPIIFIANDQYGFNGLDGPLGFDIITIDGSTYILVASYFDNEFQIIDITDIHSPVSAAVWADAVGEYNLTGLHTIRGVTIQDNTSYAVVSKTHENSMLIIDISDPYAPVFSNEITNNDSDEFAHIVGPKEFEIIKSDDSAFILVPSSVGGYLNIININDPLSPTIAGSGPLKVSGGVSNLETITTETGTYAVTTAGNGDGIHVVDITNLSSPQVLSSILSGPDRVLRLLGDEMDMFTANNNKTYALLSVYADDAVRVTDVTDPYKPIPVSVIRDGHDGFDMGRPISVTTAHVGDVLYAAISGYRDGVIQIINMSDPEKPVPVSVMESQAQGFKQFKSAGNVLMTEVNGKSYLIAASFNENALHIFDITNPKFPTMLVTVRDGQNGFNLLGVEDISTLNISGRTFIVASSFADSSIRLIDITNPAIPVQTSYVKGGMDGYDHLYHITDVDAITIGDRSLMVAGTYLTDAIVIIDISDPSNPVRLSSFHDHQDNGYMQSVQMVEIIVIDTKTYVTVASALDSVQLVDITDPTSPKRGGLISTGGNSITTDGDDWITIYGIRNVEIIQSDTATLAVLMMNDENIVYIYDMSTPLSPKYAAITPLALR